MCTGAELPLIMQGAGMGMQALGAYNSSRASKAAYNAQAQVDANNALIAQYQAEDAVRRGEVAASDRGLKTNQIKGTQRAALAANGVDLGVGSALEIQTDTDYFGGIDRARIIDTAAREAWGYKVQAQNATSNANLLRERAGAESPYMAAGTSLLTGAGKVAAGWYGKSSSGMQARFSGTSLGSSGFGSGLAYGNRDLGESF